MKNIKIIMTALIILTLFSFYACENNHKKQHTEHPSEVEDIEGTELSEVTLTEKAIERIGLQTSEVTQIHGSPLRLVVPYSSIIYDSYGQVWVYTNPKNRTFIRHKVEVDYIKGDMVYLTDGPPVGTKIISVGVAEVYGAEFEIGH
ncbi:MAG: hypothetical protein OEM46_10205 [Ignavibacteria bacterium]|nr:hypothetical protein [Ignavibacteria bacterium]